MDLRPASNDDIGALERLHAAVVADGAAHDFRYDAVAPPLGNYQRGLVWVAEAGGEIVGFVAARKLAELGNIDWLYVAPAHRRGGVARALVAAVVKELYARDVVRVRVWTLYRSTAAMAFWQRVGFAPYGVELRDDSDAAEPPVVDLGE